MKKGLTFTQIKRSGVYNNITWIEAAAICPIESKSNVKNCVNLVAVVFIKVRLFPNASNSVNTELNFSTEKKKTSTCFNNNIHMLIVCLF